jgi:hypothetical protein
MPDKTFSLRDGRNDRATAHYHTQECGQGYLLGSGPTGDKMPYDPTRRARQSLALFWILLPVYLLIAVCRGC